MSDQAGIRKLLWKPSCFYADCIFCKYFLFCFPLVCTKIISELSDYLICVLREQNGKRDFWLSSAGVLGGECLLGFKCQKSKGEKKCREEKLLLQRLLEYSLNLEGFEQCFLEDSLSLTHLSSMSHTQECWVSAILWYLCFCDFYKYGDVERAWTLEWDKPETNWLYHLVVVSLWAS